MGGGKKPVERSRAIDKVAYDHASGVNSVRCRSGCTRKINRLEYSLAQQEPGVRPNDFVGETSNNRTVRIHRRN